MLIRDIGGTPDRFWKLFSDLQRLNLFYEVAIVFDNDPGQDLSAEPCYPLYIFDRHAREEEAANGLGGIALAIQDSAQKNGFLKRKQLERLFEAVCVAEKESGSGLFLFAAQSQAAKLVNILRLRFRAHTLDTGAGIELEREKVERWKGVLTRPVDLNVAI